MNANSSFLYIQSKIFSHAVDCVDTYLGLGTNHLILEGGRGGNHIFCHLLRKHLLLLNTCINQDDVTVLM